ncbi:MAG: hypothetical protein DRJ08_05250 [Acidobacteria bacterium]|nr:MAG: hypothetical protein DRJ08_05250 [Acidobacteriota bacterium]
MRKRKKNLTQGHNGTKFIEDRTKIQKSGDGRQNSASESASARKKGVRLFPALFLLITNYKLRITAPRVGVVRGRGRQKKK